MNISDLILMSDVDGTLLLHAEEIPQRNIEALERFTRGGGRFGLATGRSVLYSRDIVRRLPVNLPCVVFNGGGLYDFSRESFLVERFLPAQARDYVSEITARFPQIGVLAVDRTNYLDDTQEKRFAQITRDNRGYVQKESIQLAEGDWYKALFVLNEHTRGFEEHIRQHTYPGVRFVYTNPAMVEMLPQDCHKGTAIEELLRLLGMRQEQLVAIGDYENDLEMISMAGLGVTLPGAHQALQGVAQLTVGPCENGAVADLIEYLEEVYGY